MSMLLDRGRKGKNVQTPHRKRLSLYVCVCVCVRHIQVSLVYGANDSAARSGFLIPAVAAAVERPVR